MTKINDILTLDLAEDIKNVIDLEDRSENEIQVEIESYIVTEGIATHLSHFVNQYTSNIKETGVWISGFYGSGKSYFGKMLGYIIDNPTINGTSARNRFLPRIKGVKNDTFLENDLRSLDAIDSRVVFLDVAKQNTDKGLAFTLFANFLKNLGFRSDLYGYMEFDFFIDGEYSLLNEKCLELYGKPWDEVKLSKKEVASAMRKISTALGKSEDDYKDTQKLYSDTIESFDSNRLKDEVEKYLSKNKNETLVFVFDEASEAISQNKFNLLDLEAISESLSSISSKVWTIAIAQEKLDDVINNANVNKSQLTKVTDRFKTKLHLESTEVDVIIKSRLLKKKDEFQSQLIEYYNKNNGLISDATHLKSSFPTKTLDAQEFSTYYPFHRYQFDLLQKFLFSSNALAATQIAARGMIITTFDVLRKQLKNKELFDFTTISEICDEAQTQPPTSIGIKYEHSRKILSEQNSDIDGTTLLKTIHFLTESGDLAFPNIENITKAYIEDLQSYYEFKPKIEKALDILVEQKQLLVSNNNYKITSDQEGQLLEEMNDFNVEPYNKKRLLTNYIKDTSLFNSVSTITDNTVSYKFNILSDIDDDINASANKKLRITVYSLYNVGDDRQDSIENIKLETQYDKGLITIVPEMSTLEEINTLISDIEKFKYMEEKYATTSDNIVKQIISDFRLMKEEKTKDILSKIEHSYNNSSVIYMYDEVLLNKDTFKNSINQTQQKLIKNNYTKRLSTQLSESVIPKLLNEQANDKLDRYFSGDDFKFFDKNGNFVGDNLKVVEELGLKLSRFVDGKSLEIEYSNAPWGYTFGTISTTLAALFRAGRLVVRYGGSEYFSYTDKTSQESFINGTKFKSSSFKSLTKSLSSSQKNQTVQLLMDMKYYEHTSKKIDWNTNDFDIADSIKILAEHFIGSITTMCDTVNGFDTLFSNVIEQKEILQHYTSKTTEANYIDKVIYFLDTKDDLIVAIETIVKAQKFVKNNFDKVKAYRRFLNEIKIELQKADKTNSKIEENSKEFDTLFNLNIVKNYSKLQQLANSTKDEYYNLMKSNSDMMSSSYRKLLSDVSNAIKELADNYPAELNTLNKNKLNSLKSYCEQRIITDINMDFHTKCQNSQYSLSDILNYIDLVPSKESDLTIIQSSFITEQEVTQVEDEREDTTTVKQPTNIKLRINNNMTVKEYRIFLSKQLRDIASKSEDEQLILTINES